MVRRRKKDAVLSIEIKFSPWKRWVNDKITLCEYSWRLQILSGEFSREVNTEININMLSPTTYIDIKEIRYKIVNQCN